jgi:hypothetical protein
MTKTDMLINTLPARLPPLAAPTAHKSMLPCGFLPLHGAAAQLPFNPACLPACSCSSYGSHFYAGEAAAAGYDYEDGSSEQDGQQQGDDEELDDEKLARRLQSEEDQLGMQGHMQGLARLGE